MIGLQYKYTFNNMPLFIPKGVEINLKQIILYICIFKLDKIQNCFSTYLFPFLLIWMSKMHWNHHMEIYDCVYCYWSYLLL